MQHSNDIVAQSLLNSISSTNEALIELAHSLGNKAGVSNTKRGLDIRRYRTGRVLEAYVDIETHHGKAYSCWLDVRWDQSMWIVDSSIRVIHHKGQDVLLQFPIRQSSAFDDFLRHLKAATDELVASANEFDFTK